MQYKSKLGQQLLHLATTAADSTAVIGTDIALDWQSLHASVGSLASKLADATTLGLHLHNSPAWIITDLAAIHAGIRNIPLPTFFSNEQLLHAITDGHIDTLITNDPDRISAITTVRNYRDITVAGRQLTLLKLDIAADKKAANDKVTYTSGTSGTPKGVILPLQHIETVALSLAEASVATDNDRALALLPLSTLLENIGSVYVPIMTGAQIIVPDPIETGLLGSSHIDVQAFRVMLNKYCPTTMILPPQLLKLVISLAAQQQLPGSLRYIAVGGAPVGTALLQQAEALQLPVYQGYGLSEACSVLTVNRPGEQRSGSVGKPLSHAGIRIGSDGEIYARGTLFEGYLNDTGSHVDELATGDLGYLDEDGFLFITGRKKNTIITNYGRNIAPEWLESELQAHPDIAQAAAFGNEAPYTTALLVPSATLANRCREQQPVLIAALNAAVDQINQQLPDYARIRKFQVANHPFSMRNDELTGNGRPRREVIAHHYANQIAAMYEEDNEQVL